MTNKQILKLVRAIKFNDLNYIANLLSEDKFNWRTTILEGGIPTIHLASRYGKLEIVQLIIKKDASLLNLKDQYNQTPILFSAAFGHEELVNYFVAQGAELNGTTHALESNDHGNAPIHWAVKNKHPHVAQCLINYGVDINLRTGHLKHLIHHVSELGYLTLVQMLLNKNPNLLNLTDEFGQTSISWAARRGQWHVVEYLASQGADFSLAIHREGHEDHGKLPIHLGAESGSHHVLRCLINHGADIDVRLGKRKLHIIHIAALNGYLDVVNILLDINPLLLNLPNAWNQTPVTLAITNGHLSLVKYLVRRGANLKCAINAPLKLCHEFLPIHCAIYYGQLDIFRYLIRIDSESKMLLGVMQYHLIHLAAMQGELEIVKILLDKNPDCLESKDNFNQTPILLAVAKGRDEVVKYLISKGANLNVYTIDPRNKHNEKTLLMWAMDERHYKVANVLILHWAVGQDKTKILPYVTNGLQALELMKQEPSLIKMLLADKRILALIAEEQHCNMSEQAISWYNCSSGKRASFFTCLNIKDETSSVFEPVKELGRGTFGHVRLFKNMEGENLAVKSPIHIDVNRSKSSIGQLKRTIALEVRLNNLAYPNGSSHELFNFHKNDMYTNRYVMPFVAGEQPNHLMSTIMDEYQLAQVVLEMALELQRIHNVGILHGDIYVKNILIHRINNTYSVRFIDFGHSVLLTKLRISTWVPSDGNCKWYPPERCGTQSSHSLKPHVNQDVYSFGFLLNTVLGEHPSYQRLIQSFPSIQTFITDSLKTEPSKRPALEVFCEQLHNELNSQEILSAPSTNVCKI